MSFKRLLLGTIVVGLAIAVVMILRVCGQTRQMAQEYCQNTVESESISPSHRWKAVVFVRNCGALDADTTHVSVLKVDELLANGPGNVFSLQGKAADKSRPLATVRWTPSNQLLVFYDKERVVEFAAGPTVRSVIVFYRHQGTTMDQPL
jgi:hypothetical protein